jgi:hypothetical protein
MTSPLPDPERPSADQPPAAPPPGEEGLIEKILEQTSHALVSPQPLTADEKRAMDDVARRMRGKPLESAVAELLLAVLRQQISGLPHFDELGPALSQRVARTLLDDPAARPRLEALWNRLQGGPA